MPEPKLKLKEILEPVEGNIKKVESLLLSNLETDIPLLTEIGHYILQSGGKRVRPAMLLCSAGAFGFEGDEACLAANVIEYIHTATLLHDDVVDNAEMRRSKKSTRSVWGNEAAVLVGDYLFTVSFKYLARLNSMPIIEMMSKATTMMARGEILQLTRAFENSSEEEYLEIVIHKTACLIGAGMAIGGILGGANKEQIDALYNSGESIGVSFQMIDDYLDYIEDRQAIGKPMGIDLKERKITLPLSHLLKNASTADKESVLEILDFDEIVDKDISHVAQLMRKYNSLEYTKQEATKYAEKAKKMLSIIPENQFRKSIELLADYIVNRES